MMTKKRQKCWWRVDIRDENGRISDHYRAFVFSRNEAKWEAAKAKNLESITNMTALPDRSLYNIIPQEEENE